MGKAKKEHIDKDLLFSTYLNIFKDMLMKLKAKLMVIGYSFMDEHINNIIVEAIERHDVHLHIINPMAINQNKKHLDTAFMHNSEQGNLVYSAIRGYYPALIKELFPQQEGTVIGDGSTIFWNQVKTNYFEIL